MFQHIVCSLANRQGLFAFVSTCKIRLDTTTKMVVVTSLFNLVISSFPDNMFYHAWMHECMAVDLSWWFQQHCSSLFVHQTMDSLFRHAWTDEQACQQPCSNLSTSKNKLFLRVYLILYEHFQCHRNLISQ